MEQATPRKAGIGAYIALIFAIIFFSGLSVSPPMKALGAKIAEATNVAPEKVHKIFSVFDFNTLNGKFGSVIVPDSKGSMKAADSKAESGEAALGKGNFSGKGGEGARQGFMFALTLVPTTMFALGMVAVLEHYGALEAMRRIFSVILRPVMGVPGDTGLAMIASFQSTDAGAALTRSGPICSTSPAISSTGPRPARKGAVSGTHPINCTLRAVPSVTPSPMAAWAMTTL